MELPSHPEADDPGAGKGTEPKSWGTVAAFVIVGVLLAMVVILDLTGVVGPAAR